jgi:hypothetical protein
VGCRGALAGRLRDTGFPTIIIHLELRNKRNVFIEETATKKAVHITLITPIGVKRNDYYDIVHSFVTAEDLFKE